ncbi:hypothetical protein HPB50_006544 [Hyalomma asiaticum]|uniref:Uncharacterized protein n=1 Tax=Hyalomma asiaticum TaxID=266040 RepID=A0ACB7T5U9_HYAAI|nr:hypothetical protein HPB50_006544 [Hyalomma asiaticum]
MARSAPDRLTPQFQHPMRSQVQDRRGSSPTGISPTTGGPSPDSISPSPPPVRVHELAALPHRRGRSPGGEGRGDRYPHGGTEGTQLQDERFCIILWVVGSSLAFPLVLSGWLFLVPFMVHANWTPWPPSSVPPQSARSTALSTLSPTTAASPTSATPWQYIPSACIVPVTLPTRPARLNVSAPYSFGPANATSRPIFCLFNNTHVNAWNNITSSPWDYVFATMPFALCPYVVYWSVGIEDGNITSRQPDYDEQYGLYRLRAIADSLNFNTVKILLALGGYPEDAPHFSRLGWDQAIADRLLENIVSTLERFGLNGITVHWVKARAGCEGPDDVTDSIITVILELTKASQLVAQEAADVVDHFFLATHSKRGTGGKDTQFCEARTRSLHQAYRSFVDALPAQKLRRSQLCLTDSLMPWTVKGIFTKPKRFSFPNNVIVGTSIQTECKWPSACTFTENTSCIIHLGQKVSTSRYPDLLFVVDGIGELSKRVNFNYINATQLASAPGDPMHACVLLLDLDADNYVDQCGGKYPRYALMRNYYYGTLGKTPSGGGDFNGTIVGCY